MNLRIAHILHRTAAGDFDLQVLGRLDRYITRSRDLDLGVFRGDVIEIHIARPGNRNRNRPRDTLRAELARTCYGGSEGIDRADLGVDAARTRDRGPFQSRNGDLDAKAGLGSQVGIGPNLKLPAFDLLLPPGLSLNKRWEWLRRAATGRLRDFTPHNG